MPIGPRFRPVGLNRLRRFIAARFNRYRGNVRHCYKAVFGLQSQCDVPLARYAANYLPVAVQLVDFPSAASLTLVQVGDALSKKPERMCEFNFGIQNLCQIGEIATCKGNAVLTAVA